MTTRIGLEVLQSTEGRLLKGRTVGLICNQASITPSFAHVVDVVKALPGVKIGALLGPEHGVRGEAQDMIAVEAGGAEGHVDRALGVPVYSLYGDSFASLTPTPKMLEGLDALVFDMQDVGSRYYTFYATMVYAMRAAMKAGIAFFVLDRPNPLGGVHVEGGPQHDGFDSFVGPFPLPVRHGLTVGEIARWANDKLGIGCDLTVVAMEGWKRSMLWEATSLPFIPPSPNMPTPDTARVYPGMCLVEGTNLSEARGTTRPFEQSGAPFLDPDALAAALNAEKLPGVHFRPCWFKPTFHKFAMQDCGGVFLHVTDADTFLPYRTGLAFLEKSQALARDRFRWRTETYEFVDDPVAIDLLTGSAAVRTLLDAGRSLTPLFAAWQDEEEAFRRARAPYLLYT
ncbi:MAG: hypothetical protein RL199_160 [Pseudomonadota bacterium]|jgi:uncharacterized protein YbbC (DUF1343 family)